MNKQIDRQAEMLKIIEDARETYANDVTDHTENEYIREGLLNANYRKTEDIAMEIFAEIERLTKDFWGSQADIKMRIADARSEAITEFAEKLKANNEKRDGLSFKVVSFDTIDQIAEKLKGETDGKIDL